MFAFMKKTFQVLTENPIVTSSICLEQVLKSNTVLDEAFFFKIEYPMIFDILTSATYLNFKVPK
jgi:hypothetical protein